MLSLDVLGCHTIVIHYSRVSRDSIIAAVRFSRAKSCFFHIARSVMGFFNDHRESGPWFNISYERRCLFDSIVSPSLYWGVRTHTDHRESTPCWPTNTSSNGNLDPDHAQPCLASVGNPSWAAGWYGCGSYLSCFVFLCNLWCIQF